MKTHLAAGLEGMLKSVAKVSSTKQLTTEKEKENTMKRSFCLFACAALVLVAQAGFTQSAAEPVGNPGSPSGAAGDMSVQFKGVSSLGATDVDGNLNIVDGPITMECWVMLDDHTTYTGFMAYGFTYKLGLTNTKEYVYTHYGIVDMVSGVTVDPGPSWHHYAAVWTPGTGVEFFIDGASVGSFANTSNPRDPQNANLTIGGENNGNVPLTGSMDRARIHHAALTAAQLDSVAGSPKPPLASTLVHYDFDEGKAPYLNGGSIILPLMPQNEVKASSASDWEIYK